MGKIIGAYSCVEKFNIDKIKIISTGAYFTFNSIIGDSKALKAVLEKAKKAAVSLSPIFW